jgi:hypothetical protein
MFTLNVNGSEPTKQGTSPQLATARLQTGMQARSRRGERTGDLEHDLAVGPAVCRSRS